jgi:peptidoglycan/LPS O-acetylase OafA/YrhL
VETVSAPRRIFGLDALRLCAIGAVLFYHYPERPVGAARALFQNGWIGVDLFFVLSGYLIGSQLLGRLARGRDPELGRFYARRLLRTLPSYFAVLLAFYVFWPSARFGAALPLVPYLLFAQNLLGLDAFAPSWSLCVEEHFYLLFPLIAVAVLRARRPARAGAWLAGGIVALGLAARAFTWMRFHTEFLPPVPILRGYPRFAELIYYPTWNRLDGILAGVLVAAVQIFRPERWRALGARLSLGAGAALFVVAAALAHVRMGFSGSVFVFPALAASFACFVVFGTSVVSSGSRRLDSAANYLAQLSYALYLVNLPAYALGGDAASALGFGPRGLATAGMRILFTFGFALALHYSVEKPGLALRDRLLAPRRMYEPALAPSES